MIKNECSHAYKLLDHAECLWCENCVEKLVKRLSKKPEVTEAQIEKCVVALDDEVDVGLYKMDKMKRVLINWLEKQGVGVEK